MSAGYVVRRILLFFVVVWAATTFIFFLPKLAPGRNPIVERIGMMVATGGINAAGHAGHGRRLRDEVRARQAALAAVPDVPRRPVAR